MSSFWKVAVLAALTAISHPAQADGIAAALTPPFPATKLPTPDILGTPSFIGSLPMPQVSRAAVPQSFVADIVARQANISNLGTACAPDVALTTGTGAMLDLKITAPCLPSTIVKVAHSGLSFTMPLSMIGAASVRLPAMEENASVAVTLSDGETLYAETSVPQTRNYARVALQWDGADPGELIAAAPAVLNGEVFHLGQSSDAEGKVLHVFSRRIDDVATSGVVRLSLRSDVTAENCATGHAAKVHRAVPGEPVSAYDLQITGPGCGAVGQSLELKNVLQDLKLSQN